MKKGHEQQLKKLYQIGVPISEIAKTFKIAENDVIRICKNVKRI